MNEKRACRKRRNTLLLWAREDKIQNRKAQNQELLVDLLWGKDNSGRLSDYPDSSGSEPRALVDLHWGKDNSRNCYGLAASDVTRFCSGQEKTKSETGKLNANTSRIFLRRNCFKMRFKLLLCTYLRCSARLCAALSYADLIRSESCWWSSAIQRPRKWWDKLS